MNKSNTETVNHLSAQIPIDDTAHQANSTHKDKNKLTATTRVNNSEHQRITSLLKLMGLLLLCYLSYAGVLKKVMIHFFLQPVNQINNQYLDAAAEVAVTMEVISEIKSLLAVVQSSSGGISFFIDVQVQLGLVLNVIVELVDHAWKVSLAALTAIEGLKILLYLSHFFMTPLLVVLFVLLGTALAMQSWLPNVAKKLSRASRLGLFLVVFTHVVLPLALLLSGTVSHHYFSQNRADIHHGFIQFRGELPQHQNETDMNTQIKNSIKHYKHAHRTASNQSSGYAKLASKHFVNSFTEFFLVPMILIGLLSSLVVSVLRTGRKPR
jgi:hypothetical protein